MGIKFILVISIILQFIASFLAFRLVYILRRRVVWITITSVIFLMAVRRLIALYGVIIGKYIYHGELSAELVALATSVLIIIALVWIKRLLLNIRQTEEELRKERDRSQKYLDIIGVIVVAIDADQKITFINRKGCEILGCFEQEVIGKNWFDNFIPERVRDEVRDVFSRLIAGEVEPVEYCENPILNKKGEERIIFWHNTILNDEEGNIIGILSSGEDITERKKTAEELIKSKELMSNILSASPVGIGLVENRILNWANEAMLEMFGFESEYDYMGKSAEILYASKEEYERVGKIIYSNFKEGKVTSTDAKLKRKDGSVFYGHIKISPLDPKDPMKRAIAAISDISWRKEAEEKIKHLNSVLYAIRKVNQLISSKKDRDRLIKEICEELIKTRGYLSAWSALFDETGSLLTISSAGLGSKFKEMAEQVKQGKLPPCGQKAISQSDIVINEYPFSDCLDCPLKENYFTKATMTLPLKYDKKMYGLLSVSIPHLFIKEEEEINLFKEVGRDVSFALYNLEIEEEKKEVEEKLRKSEAHLRALIESSTDAIITLDCDRNILTCNPAFLKMYGYTYEEIIGKSGSILHPSKESFDRVGKEIYPIINKKGFYKGERELVRKDGTLIPIETTTSVMKSPDGSIVGYVVIMRDITEKRKAEKEKEIMQAQLMQAQKMEAIGLLAGGLAHDFNNLLTAIQGYTEMMIMKFNKRDPLYKNLKYIHDASTQGASLIRQLLLFSRRQPTKLISLNINKTIRGILKMLKRIIGEDIEIKTELDPELLSVRADESNIEQMIMNLVVNARDAMPKGGRVTIKSRNVTLDEKQCKVIPEAKPGNYVCFTVSDTGIGMDKETISHIFEPFFTTKGFGKGTGLGLSVVYGIIKQLEGFIDVKSKLGHGTTFDIYLPAISEKPKAERKEVVSTYEVTGKGERILLVEDEEAVRSFAKDALEGNGYIVFEAETAKEALDIFEKEMGNFLLVFSDMVLPDKDGLELVEQLSSKKPDLVVILTSGYTDDKSKWPEIKEKRIRFLQKPYGLTDLLRTVREAININ